MGSSACLSVGVDLSLAPCGKCCDNLSPWVGASRIAGTKASGVAVGLMLLSIAPSQRAPR